MFGDIPTPFKNKATRELEKYAASNIFRSQGYNFESTDPLVSYADRISLVMEARLLLQGDAWKNILRSVEITQKDVDLIETHCLDKLVGYCENYKNLFRPKKLIYKNTIELIHKLKSLTAHHGDAFQDYMEHTFGVSVSRGS